MTQESDSTNNYNVIEQVDALNEQVKTLALNMAIYLAKHKNDSEELARLEPDFIRLVNGTVKVVQDLAVLINAARNTEPLSWEPATQKLNAELMEMKLRSILDQCSRIIQTLTEPTRVRK